MSEESQDFDGLPAIKPEQDEVASYQRTGRREAPRQSNFNGILVFVIVLMAIMMGVGGFTLWQVQQKLHQANTLLTQGQQDTQGLEQRLSQTGDTASKKFTDMAAQIKTNVSQIDKLWASAYRQNKADIKANKDDIGAVKTSTGKMQQQVSQLNASVSKVSAAAATLKQDSQSQLDDMSTQVSLVRGQVQGHSVTMEANKRSAAVLRKQVQDLQDAVNVINRYRQQVNQQLLQLRSEVKAATPPSQPSAQPPAQN